MRQSLFVLLIVAIIKVKVLRIDLKRKRISLSINRARREGAHATFKRYQPAEEKSNEE